MERKTKNEIKEEYANMYKTNFQAIKGMSLDVLAWLLMSRNACDMCTEKRLCDKGEEEKKTCIQGVMDWLSEKPDERSLEMFAIAEHNVLVTEYNNSLHEEGGKGR